MHSVQNAGDPEPPPIPVLLVTKKNAAVMIGVSLRTIDYLIKKGKLETRRIGRRVLVVVASLRRLARYGDLGPLSE